MAGAVLFLVTLVVGGLDTGWTLYPPYSLEGARGLGILIALVGVFLAGFSSILTGVNFIATIHKLRPAGMGWFDLPLFLWALYATAIIQILATPVLGITAALGFMERIFHLGLFMPEYGGDPVLFQHFFWFYSHPAVYIMILPAMGIVSEVVSVFSRKPIFGYRFIAMSSLAIAVIGFLVWGHHMFVSGQSRWANIIFSFLTLLVAIPSAIKTFNWLATMYKGVIVLKTPMLYVLSFFAIFGVGGLTGLFLGALATDIPLHDTYFVVAHFHFVMVGAVMIAFLAGVHYWWPKMTGRMYDERLGATSAVLVFLGFNLTFIPQFIVGVAGMPRRYATYAAEFQHQNRLSTVGAFVLTAGPGHRPLRPARLARAAPASAPRPTPGAPPRWSGRPPRPRPTTTSRRRRPASRPTTSPRCTELPDDAGWVATGRRWRHERGRARGPGGRLPLPAGPLPLHGGAARRRQARGLALPGPGAPLLRRALRGLRGLPRQPPRRLPLRPPLPRLAHGRRSTPGAHRQQPHRRLGGAGRPARPPAASCGSPCSPPCCWPACFLVVKYFEYTHKLHNGVFWGAAYHPSEEMLASLPAALRGRPVPPTWAPSSASTSS